MSRRVPRVIILMVLVAGVSGCSATINPASIADAQTAARVKSVLVNDPVVGVYPIEVRVANRVARLTGRVPTDDVAARAVALARDVAGVVDVVSVLRVGGMADQAADAQPTRAAVTDPLLARTSGPGDRRLLAVGGSFGWNNPDTGRLDTSASLGPLIRVGSGRGLGLSIGFGWYGTDLRSPSDAIEVIGRVRLRPVMGGLGYTIRRERVSLEMTAVAGVAFNSVSSSDEVTGRAVPLQVGNSLAMRPAASVWIDLSGRTAINLSAGYVVTRPRLTTLEAGQVVRRRLTADAFLVRLGLVYKLF